VLAGARETVARDVFDLCGVVRNRVGLVRVDVVRGDHFDEVFELGRRLEEARRREVPRFPVALRQGVVRDLLDERLHEPVVAALRRTRIDV
jgi:hypothetical protein